MIKGLYNAPAGCDALGAVAKALAIETGGDMDALRRCIVLLPTRRAIRILEEKLPEAFGLSTILLPRLMAIGDIELPDEEDEQGRPPPRGISGVERLYSIMPFLEAEGLGTHSFDAAWRMAQEAVKLIDLLQTEDLGPEALDVISRDALPEHWQDNIGAFQNAARAWMRHLAEHRRINSASARTYRIERLIEQWAAKSPADPVWLIGSTGSIPAVRRLMKAALALPKGAVLLPGVDMDLADSAWETIPDAHPQAILKKTLAAIGGYDRREVSCWPECDIDADIGARMTWLSTALSPRPCSSKPQADDAIALCVAHNPQDEIATIAHICVRELAATPTAQIVIVANDPDLPQRLMPMLAPYGVGVDASSGLRFDATGYGQRVLSLMRSLCPSGSILDLLGLLKQPGFAGHTHERMAHLADAEYRYLRHPLRRPDTIDDFIDLLDEEFKNKFSPLRIEWTQDRSIADWARNLLHIFAQWLIPRGSEDHAAAEGAQRLLEDFAALRVTRRLDAEEALRVFSEQLAKLPCRLPPMHSKTVYVLGTLEARLMHADIGILTGLNEGTWPDAPRPSPFLSRAMRHAAGLPDSERHAALAGHDFQQAFMARKIYLTRAARSGDGPSLPARWLQRLKAVTPAEIWGDIEMRGRAIHTAMVARHMPDSITPIAPPAPVATSLPDILWVTGVELWRADPYSFWAKNIARLKSLDPLLPDIDAAAKGTLWHEILERFVIAFDATATLDKQRDDFMTIVEAVFVENELPDSQRRLWRARLLGTAESLIEFESQRRLISDPLKPEDEYEGVIEGQVVKARADRIDLLQGGSTIPCDYKTGDAPAKSTVLLGYSCQLTLLALILNRPVYELEYVSIKGGRAAPKSTKIDWTKALEAETRAGFAAWCRLFIEQGHAFVCLADFGTLHQKKAQDYLYLARHQEWGDAA